jgi:DNA repair protein RadC
VVETLRTEARRILRFRKELLQMSEKLNINQWAEEDRPREKMATLGAEALSSAELLAILIGSGSTKESAVDLMKRILADCNNSLNTLGKKSIHDLCQYNGVGEAKAITILAACELGKRRQAETPEERPDLGNATSIYNHMHPVMQDLDVEEFWVLLLNQHHRLIKKMRIARGGITATIVDIRLIIREAVLCNATQLVVCHNHPSGNIMPSKDDDNLTLNIMRACQIMNIYFADHVIITDGAYYSYHEKGKC